MNLGVLTVLHGQIASTWVESFDVLLDAYEEISENLPQLLEYSELFKRHAHMRKVLELMYGDILEFHRRALKFFSRPSEFCTPDYPLCSIDTVHYSLETAVSFFMENFPNSIPTHPQ